MRSPDIKRGTHVLEFLATWPLRYAVTIALGMVCLGTIAAMLPRASKAAIPDSIVNPIATTNIVALAQHIADAHLFGQEAGQVPGAAAAVTAAAIKVEGLLYSDDPKMALAILEVNGNSGSFKVGDVLADGEKLTVIAPDAVQLTLGTAQRVVEMPTQFGGPGDGIALTGATGLAPNVPFPGFAAYPSEPNYRPGLRAVSVPVDADPLEQLRTLRQQLIAPIRQTAPTDPE